MKTFPNQRDDQTFHCSVKLFFILIQLKMWSDIVISTSFIVNNYYFTKSIFIE